MWGEICDRDSPWVWVTDYRSPDFRTDGLYELADHFLFEGYVFKDFATSELLRVPNCGLCGCLTWSVQLDDGPHEFSWQCTAIFAQHVVKFNDELGLCYVRQLEKEVRELSQSIGGVRDCAE
jgi:hypothetical protein